MPYRARLRVSPPGAEQLSKPSFAKIGRASEAQSGSLHALSPSKVANFLRSAQKENHFHHALVDWFRGHGRELPWRRTRDPYAVLVSEFMLQQTQVTTVIPYYQEWLRRFPDVRALARASESDVLHAWQGLGYYSRARNLHRCAREIVCRYNGEIPTAPAELLTLPGLGRYTANAVAVFAFDRSLPLIEANTARLLARLTDLRDPIDSSAGREKLWAVSATLVPASGARDFQAALMDLGALVCSARVPRCGICPIKPYCTSIQPQTLPVKRQRQPTVKLIETHHLSMRPDGVLLSPCRQRWRGMWMLPVAPRTRARTLYAMRFSFTHHQVTLRVVRSRARRARRGERWFSWGELAHTPIATPHRRALAALAVPAR